MKHQRLNQSQSQEQQQEQVASTSQTRQAGQEFATVEDLLRHDALHTPVPPRVAERLVESVSQLPPRPPKTWWHRLFGSR